MSYVAHLPNGKTVERRTRTIAVETAAAMRKRAWRRAFVHVVQDALPAEQFDQLCRATDQVVDGLATAEP